ncbi:hypothetical protein T484DRAFT_1891717 [Baffinella frigidus]|nr:hypothetical protein T484DRAFT_1891717 [Cryptophyta sp. CCMP2293]
MASVYPTPHLTMCAVVLMTALASSSGFSLPPMVGNPGHGLAKTALPPMSPPSAATNPRKAPWWTRCKMASAAKEALLNGYRNKLHSYLKQQDGKEISVQVLGTVFPRKKGSSVKLKEVLLSAPELFTLTPDETIDP